MNKKLHKILLIIFVAIFTFSLMCLAATNARYVSSQAPSSSSTASEIDGDELKYTVADQYVVTNQAEFTQAVQDGVSNIKISSDEDEPFFIEGEELEIEENLILDLNGHEVQCISRDPILQVPTGKKLIVVDTSESETGSFYNPVGSVLNITGGLLTASSGKYESGPRKSEYYSLYSSDPSSYTGGIIGGTVTGVTVYVNTFSGGTVTTTAEVTGDMPKITMQTNPTTGVNSGNIYFDTALSGYAVDIFADTYLYYIYADAEATLANPEKADFWYSYNEDDGTQVIVCGYYEDIATAKSCTENGDTALANYYLGRDDSDFAAIKMQSGYLYVRGGSFYSYFGVNSAYCVSSTGGATKVYDGTFEALEEGVCVRCAISGTTSDYSISVYDGAFKSYKGDMIKVSGGKMLVTGGTFDKDATVNNYSDSLGNTYNKAYYSVNNSAIDISGGSTLTITGTSETDPVKFIISGSYCNAISCADGEIDAENATFVFNESSVSYSYSIGIDNEGGTVATTNCLFDMPDGYSVGIESAASGSSGSVTAEGCVFVLSGTDAKGINADGGTVSVGDATNIDSTSCLFYIDHVANCWGVYADSTSALTLNVNAAQFVMGQRYYSTENSVPEAYTAGTDDFFNSAGVYMNASNGTLNLVRAAFIIAGSYTAGVWAEAGSIVQDNANSDYTTAMLVGVVHSDYSGNGLAASSSSHSQEKFGENYFVAMYGANQAITYTAATSYSTGTALSSIQFAGCSTTNAIGSYGIFSTSGSISADNLYVALLSTYGAAVYSSGGDITIADFECDVRSTDSNATTYPGKNTLAADVSSSAISVSSGSIAITNSTINTDAYGFLVSSGDITFSGANSLNAVRSTAIYVDGGTFTLSASASLTLTSNIGTQDGWQDKDGTLFTDYLSLNYNSTDAANANYIQPDGIYVSGGSLISSGTVAITFSGLDNDCYAENGTILPYTEFVIKSYAVRVTGSAASTVTINKGSITSSIGGGVEVSAGSNSQVTLGVQGASGNTSTNSLVVTTTGTGDKIVNSDDSYLTSYDGTYNFSTYNWKYAYYTQGGHAVKVNNGLLTIYSGTYQATGHGNGIYVNGSESLVNIYDGVFSGVTAYDTSYLGPAASYSLKLLDGTMNVYGGDFSTTSNCAFVMGSSSNYTCTANFYGGTFEDASRSIMSLGYCDVTIGGDSNYSCSLYGSTYAVGLEAFDNNSSYQYRGTFTINSSATITAKDNAVWYGNSNIVLTINGGEMVGGSDAISAYGNYNSYVSGTIIITGGSITSTGRYGIQLSTTDLTMTGGTVTGKNYGLYFATATGTAQTISIENATIESQNHGIYFAGNTNNEINIAGATITGGSAGDWCNGIYFYGTAAANITIASNSTISSGGTAYGIQFNSTVFSGNYTFTISDSEVSGGSGILFADTGSNGTFLINGTSTIEDKGSYYGLEFGGNLSMTLTVSGSAKITGGQYAVYVGSYFNGSITVEGSAELVGSGRPNGQSSTYDIYLNNVSGNPSITESSSAHTNTNKLMVYINNRWANTNIATGDVTVNRA